MSVVVEYFACQGVLRGYRHARQGIFPLFTTPCSLPPVTLAIPASPRLPPSQPGAAAAACRTCAEAAVRERQR